MKLSKFKMALISLMILFGIISMIGVINQQPILNYIGYIVLVILLFISIFSGRKNKKE